MNDIPGKLVCCYLHCWCRNNTNVYNFETG